MVDHDLVQASQGLDFRLVHSLLFQEKKIERLSLRSEDIPLDLIHDWDDSFLEEPFFLRSPLSVEPRGTYLEDFCSF